MFPYLNPADYQGLSMPIGVNSQLKKTSTSRFWTAAREKVGPTVHLLYTLGLTWRSRGTFQRIAVSSRSRVSVMIARAHCSCCVTSSTRHGSHSLPNSFVSQLEGLGLFVSAEEDRGDINEEVHEDEDELHESKCHRSLALSLRCWWVRPSWI